MSTPKPVTVIQIDEPHHARLVETTLQPPSPSQSDNASETVHVHTLYTAISSGTELLAYTGHMPADISVDASFATQQSTFQYPCQYGYCAVGVIIPTQKSPTPSSPSPPPASPTASRTASQTKHTDGQLVFAFREHVSSFVQSLAEVHPLPSDVNAADAAFLPAFETAVSIVMDAAPLPGDVVCVVGQGIIGLCVTAALRKFHPYCVVVTLDLHPKRRTLSTKAAGAHAAIDGALPTTQLQQALQAAITSNTITIPSISTRNTPEARRNNSPSTIPHSPPHADITIDVSGSSTGLDTAVITTRPYGRIILASWFGSKQVSLRNLGGAFHRSHITIVASQVSEVPAPLAARWTKERRMALAWSLLRDVGPVTTFEVEVFRPEQCNDVYHRLQSGEVVAALFQWAE